MALLFNTILNQEGINPSEVRLLRHQDHRAEKGRSPYELWRTDIVAFNSYQGHQSFGNRAKLDAKYWAAFIATPNSETLFVGLYAVAFVGENQVNVPHPHMTGVDLAGTCHVYDLALEDRFSDFVGRLVIDWGASERAWVQRPDRQNKRVLAIREAFREPEFPGFTKFIKQLSQLQSLPIGWIDVLRSSRGVYLLTCPKTREQYVGSATGGNGFYGRWQSYEQNGHGGNIGLKSKDPSDYQVSVLEVAGSSASVDDIIAMESQWKHKLQSREMGLNKN